MEFNLPSPLQELHDELFDSVNVRVFVKRDDLIDSAVSGNKWRKLKHHLKAFHDGGYDSILTFGGAFSNHIHATAALGSKTGIHTIGLIRGELHEPLNPTLQDATNWGMQIEYIDRSLYRQKSEQSFLANLKERFPNTYIIPEGGSGVLGAKGCEDIVTEIEIEFDIISCPCGTATTLSGILNGLDQNQQALGVSALKGGDFLTQDIMKMSSNSNYTLETEYHFGGYAKTKPELNSFMTTFEAKHDIKLDHVYTGKHFYALYDLIKKGKVNNKTIIAVHTGGLQGTRS